MKLQKYLSIFAIAAVAGFALAGCGKDDEPEGENGTGNGENIVTPGGEGENGGGTVVANPAIFNFGGSRLTRIWWSNEYNVYATNFTYNDAGMLTSMSNIYTGYKISYTDGTFIEDSSANLMVYKFTTNENGYITSLTSSESYNDPEYGDCTWQSTYTFTYDSSDRLMEAQYSYKDINTLGVVIDTDDGTLKMTWSNDLITKIESKGYKDNAISESTIVYGDNYPNIHRQYTSNLIGAIDGLGIRSEFMMVNLLGRASSQLPVRIIMNYTNTTTGYSYTKTTDISYEMNSDGLVATETGNSVYNNGNSYNNKMNYDYATFGAAMPAKRMQANRR